MHNEKKLKKLAVIAAENKTIPSEIEQFVLTKLNKKELKTFLHFYRLALSKKRLYVTTPFPISNDELENLKNLYKNKEIINSIDESLGAGIKLKNDDLVIDFTFKKYINDTIDILKN